MRPLERVLGRLGLAEAGLLTAIVLLAAGAWAFAELSDEVLEGQTASFDERILLAMRSSGDPSDPIGSDSIEEMGRDLTALGGVAVLVLLTAAVTGYLILERKRRIALLVLAAVGGGILASSLLKLGFDRPRPDLVPHGSHVYTKSFPSGHSMMAAITYLTLAALLARAHRTWRVKLYLLVVAVLATLAVGVSRVYMGVHWPTDVLAGWTAGAVWALLCGSAARWLQLRGHVEQEGVEGEEAGPVGPNA